MKICLALNGEIKSASKNLFHKAVKVYKGCLNYEQKQWSSGKFADIGQPCRGLVGLRAWGGRLRVGRWSPECPEVVVKPVLSSCGRCMVDERMSEREVAPSGGLSGNICIRLRMQAILGEAHLEVSEGQPSRPASQVRRCFFKNKQRRIPCALVV